jgi:hypothetical protein
MAADDYLEPEVAVAVAVTATVTAAVCSPPVRKVLRRGLVYGLAGLLIARDKVANAARGVAKTVREAAHTDGSPAEEGAKAASTAAVASEV